MFLISPCPRVGVVLIPSCVTVERLFTSKLSPCGVVFHSTLFPYGKAFNATLLPLWWSFHSTPSCVLWRWYSILNGHPHLRLCLL